jgi:hypothetical protein
MYTMNYSTTVQKINAKQSLLWLVQKYQICRSKVVNSDIF